MALVKYFVGNVGDGKSSALYNYLLEKEKQCVSKKKLIIIVPEQYAIKAQATLLKLSKKKVVLSPKIYSFKRLANEILDKNGAANIKRMDDSSKTILIRRLAGSIKETDTFSVDLKKANNILAIKSVISELEQYAVNDEDIFSVLNTLDSNLPDYKRLSYIRNIYESYNRYCNEHFLCFDVLQRVAELIKEKELFKDAIIAFDEFNGFTVSQLNIISLLFEQAEELLFTLNASDIDIIRSGNIDACNDSRLFFPAIRTYASLSKTFGDISTYKEEMVFLNDNCTIAHKSIIKDYFLRDKSPKESVYLENVYELKAADIEQEIRAALSQIRGLIINEGYSYRDIAIVTSDLDTYERLLFELKDEYELNIAADNTANVSENILSVFILQCLEVIDTGFAHLAVRQLVKNPLSGFLYSFAEELENHCLKYNDKGYVAFQRLSETFTELKQLFTLLEPLTDLGKTAKAKDIASAIIKMITADTVIKSAYLHSKALKKNQNDYISQINIAFKEIVDLLDSITALLDEENINISEFRELLVSALQTVRVARPVEAYDTIVLKDMLRSKHRGQFKAVFILGMNDNILPRVINSNPLFSDTLRQLFSDNGIMLSDNEEQSLLIQSYELYRSLLMANDRLYLCYPLANELNEELRPSYFLAMLKQIIDFNNSLDINSLAAGICSKYTAIEQIVSSKNDELRAFLEGLIAVKDKISLNKIKNMTEPIVNESLLNGSLGKESYSDRVSITQLESFAACPFSHFCKYGLRLRSRELFKPTAIDYGNLLHLSIENVQRALLKENKSFRDLPTGDSLMREYLTAAVDNAIKENRLTRINNEDFLYNTERIRQLVKTTLAIQKFHEEQGDFRLYACEHDFNMKLNNATLYGIIDRIDVSDDKRLRIIDYKSSDRTTDLTMLYHGLQLQLPIYMDGAIRDLNINNGINAVPSGIFYYKMSSPIIDLSKEKKAESQIDISERIKSDLRLSGIFGTEIENINALDKSMVNSEANTLMPSVSSLVIRAATKKDSTFNAYTKEYSIEDMKNIISHSKTTANSMANDIYSGRIDLSPKRYKSYDACKYCDFANICKIDDYKDNIIYLSEKGLYDYKGAAG